MWEVLKDQAGIMRFLYIPMSMALKVKVFKMSENAPVVIFCYRRKITKLIESLIENKESKRTELFIYSDGFKSNIDKNDVINLRKDLKKFMDLSLFM